MSDSSEKIVEIKHLEKQFGKIKDARWANVCDRTLIGGKNADPVIGDFNDVGGISAILYFNSTENYYYICVMDMSAIELNKEKLKNEAREIVDKANSGMPTLKK